MKCLALTLLLLSMIAAVSMALHTMADHQQKSTHLLSSEREKKPEALLRRLKLKASEAASFVKANHFNEGVCFLVDMSIGSGEKRFFVYDLQKDSIRSSGLVTHGNCNQYWLEGRKYDNTVGCGCTSLGKYSIGYPYMGRFGRAFKLYGLEKTNSHAFDRYVVLHAHSCVPEKEVNEEICQSNGCPTVSPLFLQQLEPLIRQSTKPILLWIFP